MLPSTVKLDKRDLNIIRLLQKDCRVSLSKIAEDLGISHVTVGRRLERLINDGFVKPALALNPTKFDLYLSVILMEVESQEDIDAIVNQFQDCPRILSIMNATGNYNLIITSIAENRKALESVAGHCSPRTQRKVRRSETLLCTPVTNTFLTIPLATPSEDERCNCGLNCLDCSAYILKRCPGCPGKPYYRSK